MCCWQKIVVRLNGMFMGGTLLHSRDPEEDYGKLYEGGGHLLVTNRGAGRSGTVQVALRM
jgi:hypothetical protein